MLDRSVSVGARGEEKSVVVNYDVPRISRSYRNKFSRALSKYGGTRESPPTNEEARVHTKAT